MPIKIMLDAGHAGKQNTPSYFPEYCEAQRMWQLFLYLKAALVRCGFEVGQTRSDQAKDLEVYSRGKKAAGYDLFLSLHSNAISPAPNESVDRPVMIHYLDAKDSVKAFAHNIGDAVRELIGAKQKTQLYTREGKSGEYYGVLRGAKAARCPVAFIIEHGFHTCTKTAKWLLSDANLKILAEKEAEIICKEYGMSYKREGKPAPAPAPAPSGSFKAGDLVSIAANATYYDGKIMPSWVKGQKWFVHSASGDRVVIDKNESKTNSIMSAVNAKHLTLASASAPAKSAPALRVGALVELTANATYYSGKSIPSWVKAQRWYVSYISGDRVVIDKNESKTNSICSPVKKDHLIVVG